MMAGYGSEALEMVKAQASGVPRGEKTWYWYSGTETGDAQVGG